MQIYFYILMTSKKVSIMNFKGKTWTIKNRILDETKSFKQVCKKKLITKTHPIPSSILYEWFKDK